MGRGLERFVVAAMGAGLWLACVGDDPDTTSSSSSSGGGGDAGCLTEPPPVSEGKFCAFEKRYYERCGKCEECRQKNLTDCVSFASGLSTPLKDALVECVDALRCTELKDALTNDPCIKEKAKAVVPNAKQEALKKGFCDRCPALGDACTNFYTATGLGTIALLVSDDIVGQIENKCLTFPGTCTEVAFTTCVNAQFCDYFKGRDACDTTLCQ